MKRRASTGDDPAGGGLNASQVQRSKKVPCPRCGKPIANSTEHKMNACDNYARAHNIDISGQDFSVVMDEENVDFWAYLEENN